MLGDILFEAMQDIEFYQAEYPELYDQYREEIERLKDQMRRLQTTIETPPGGWCLLLGPSSPYVHLLQFPAACEEALRPCWDA